MKSESTFNLGQVLVKAGNITLDQLQSAIKTSHKTGARIKDVLVESGYISESQLEVLFSKKLNVPALSLRGVNIRPDVAGLLPYELVERFSAVPLFISGKVLTVATDDPFDYASLEKIARLTNKNICTAFTTSMDIKELLDRYKKPQY